VKRAFILSGLKATCAFIGALFVFNVWQFASLTMSLAVGFPAIILLFLLLWAAFSGAALMLQHERCRETLATQSVASAIKSAQT
jgi:hypothetical protein